MLSIEPIRTALETSGYFFSSSYFLDQLDNLPDALQALATQLGQPVRGRNSQTVEVLTPKNTDEAHRNSLSNKYGKDALPFHIDMAHQRVPSRYLIFACSSANGEIAPTLLLETSSLELTLEASNALDNAVFLIKNGRRSFYANIKKSGVPYLRWDPGCMFPQDASATAIARELSDLSNISDVKVINWSVGALLMVDNWRMLHSRGVVHGEHGNRTLLRMTIQ